MCPISSSVSLMIFACCAFVNRAPNSASAAEAATILRIVHSECIAPFSLIGWLSCGIEPRKKWPPALLLDFVAVRYDASECTFKIISDAEYLTIAC